MNRFTTLLAALLGASLVLFPLAHADAATKKKKKPAAEDEPATPSPKKKSTPAPDKPVKPADPSDHESTVTTKKGGAPTALDLPLPTKPEPKSSSGTPAPAKKTPATPAPAKPAAEPTAGQREHAPNATVELEDIVEFPTQAPRIQQLLRDAVDLTRLNLTYTFGSADPDSGGMDCSGTIYYLLRAHRFSDVPRDSSGQYLWARKSAIFFPVVSKSEDSVEFNELLPGDLMFWTGTYDTQRDVPISHVMLYLGREKATGKRIMFGASDGRSYHGIQRWGVSIFDFKMPGNDPEHPEKSKSQFVGFARIPGLRTGVGNFNIAEKTKAAELEPSAANKSTDAKSKGAVTKIEPPAAKSKSSSRKKKKN